MRTHVSTREPKARLNTYLRLVREGATVIVTDRGRPVAELRAIPQGARDEDAALDRMLALGEARRDVREPLPSVRPVRVGGTPVSRSIREEREDRI